MVTDVMALSPPAFHLTNAHISCMRGRSTIFPSYKRCEHYMVIDVMELSPPAFHHTNAHISWTRGRSTITFKLTFMCINSHSLTEQNHSFQNWQKKWSLVHGPRVEGHSSTIPMSRIQWSQRFIDLSNGHHSMACWIPSPTGFQGHLLNPYLGHRM